MGQAYVSMRESCGRVKHSVQNLQIPKPRFSRPLALNSISGLTDT